MQSFSSNITAKVEKVVSSGSMMVGGQLEDWLQVLLKGPKFNLNASQLLL
jgi:hypothetical protein